MIYVVINHSSSWKYILMIALVWGPFGFATIYAHEAGHLYANKKYGGVAYKATLWPLGGFSDCYIENCTCMQEFYVALAGPLTHIPQIFAWMMGMLAASEYGIDYFDRPFSITLFDNGGIDDWSAEFCKQMLVFNLVLFCLNVFIAVYPLDASRMTAAILVQCGVTTDRACLYLIIWGALLGFGCLIYGISGLISSSGDAITYLLAGVFLLWTIYGMFRLYNARRVTDHPLFDADCYRDRRTYVGGNNGATRNFTNGRATVAAPRNRRSDIENGKRGKARQSTFLNDSDPDGFHIRKTKEVKARDSGSSKGSKPKKMSYGKALKKAKKMKVGELKKECQQRGIQTGSFVEREHYEEAYAKSFSR